MAEIFDSAADRIAFSEAVDFIDQGRARLVPPAIVEACIRRGLLVREDGELRVTDEGRRQHKLAMRERFSDG
jgi:hypothetical protein